MSITPQELESILTVASQENSTAANAISEMIIRQKAIAFTQNQLAQLNKLAYETYSMDSSGAGLAREVRQAMGNDREVIKKFDASLSSCTAEFIGNVPFSVRTHKWKEIFYGTEHMLDPTKSNDETNIVKLAFGELLHSNSTKFFPILGANYWGSSLPTYQSYALLSILFTMSNRTISDISLNCPVTHVSPLPVFTLTDSQSNLTLDPTWRFSYNTGTTNFSFIHSGYAFGAYRGEEKLYPNDRLFGPEDCSSAVAKQTGSRGLFSTADQLCTYWHTKRSPDAIRIPPQWAKAMNNPGSMEYSMVSEYIPVEPTSVAIGDIYFSRTFKEDEKGAEIGLGTSGHTAIVVGKNGNDAVITVGFNRNMPNPSEVPFKDGFDEKSCGMDGFGVQEFLLNPPNPSGTAKKGVFFLRQLHQGQPLFTHFDTSVLADGKNGETHIELLKKKPIC